jgi:hypothetical protein
MEREELYKDKNLLLEYIKNGNFLHETWWGVTPSEIFLKYLDIILSALEDKKANGLILDAREHKGLAPKDQEIAAKRHSEYAQKYGGLKQAIIIPKYVVSKFSVENYNRKLDKESQKGIKYFNDIPSAEQWLRE